MGDATSFVRRVKQRYRRRRLERLGVCERISCDNVLRLGSGSGSWSACIEDMDEESVVYSFGAGTDISFDLDFHERTGAEVHIFDPTPRSIEWMHAQRLPARVFFHEYGVGATDGTIDFFPPRRASSSHFSPVRRYLSRPRDGVVTAPVYRFSTIAARLGHDHVALVKMDIEGGEYDVIDDMLRAETSFDQLLVEYHHAYSTIPISRTVDSVTGLDRAGYRCFYISDRTYEFSFLRQPIVGVPKSPGLRAATGSDVDEPSNTGFLHS
ncbi:MAG: FkbM family methyltransferase [Proteobacteria bacterium]|nr:MAG: FkbM family methyltransferase [Pseudomonadota bacterium]